MLLKWMELVLGPGKPPGSQPLQGVALGSARQSSKCPTSFLLNLSETPAGGLQHWSKRHWWAVSVGGGSQGARAPSPVWWQCWQPLPPSQVVVSHKAGARVLVSRCQECHLYNEMDK